MYADYCACVLLPPQSLARYEKFNVLNVKVIYSRTKGKSESLASQHLCLMLQTVGVGCCMFTNVSVEEQQKEREPLLPQSHLLICSSICLTNMDSPPACGSGSRQVSLGGGPLDSGLLRPSRERTRLDRISRMVSE